MEDTARYRYIGGRSMETFAFRFDAEPGLRTAILAELARRS